MTFLKPNFYMYYFVQVHIFWSDINTWYIRRLPMLNRALLCHHLKLSLLTLRSLIFTKKICVFYFEAQLSRWVITMWTNLSKPEKRLGSKVSRNKCALAVENWYLFKLLSDYIDDSVSISPWFWQQT